MGRGTRRREQSDLQGRAHCTDKKAARPAASQSSTELRPPQANKPGDEHSSQVGAKGGKTASPPTRTAERQEAAEDSNSMTRPGTFRPQKGGSVRRRRQSEDLVSNSSNSKAAATEPSCGFRLWQRTVWPYKCSHAAQSTCLASAERGRASTRVRQRPIGQGRPPVEPKLQQDLIRTYAASRTRVGRSRRRHAQEGESRNGLPGPEASTVPGASASRRPAEEPGPPGGSRCRPRRTQRRTVDESGRKRAKYHLQPPARPPPHTNS